MERYMKSKKRKNNSLTTIININETGYGRVEGIYLSTKTGRIFEAISDGHGMIIIRYCDDNIPEFGPVVREKLFAITYAMDIYIDIINYYDEGI
jgi:hypothetical protein